MTDMPWSKFFWTDWEADPGLRLCSLSAQGLWMRLLCVAAKHEPKGYVAINGNPLSVTDIARLAGASGTEVETLMDELDRNGVFSRDRKGRIYSRRMIRDEKRSKEGRKHKKRGLEQAAEKAEKNPEPSRGAARGASTQKLEARSQRQEREESPKPPNPPPVANVAPESAQGDLLKEMDPPSGQPPSEHLIESEFVEWYSAYPKKSDRKAALKAYRTARKAVSAEILLDGARRYAALCRNRKTEKKYIKGPAAWLNAGKWADEDLGLIKLRTLNAGRPTWDEIIALAEERFGVGHSLTSLSRDRDLPQSVIDDLTGGRGAPIDDPSPAEVVHATFGAGR